MANAIVITGTPALSLLAALLLRPTCHKSPTPRCDANWPPRHRESSFCQKLRPEYTFVRSFSGGGQPLPRWRYISKSTQMDRRFLTTLGLVLILVPTASASFGLDSESGFGCGSTHITASGFSCGSRLTLWRRGVIYDPNLDMAV